ncbi:MAG: response regulator, partial [Bacteroides sp.]|nr:response regulator [Bacteroides sp.]
IYLYHIPSGTTRFLSHPLQESMEALIQIDSVTFFAGTQSGIHKLIMGEGNLEKAEEAPLSSLKIPVQALYFDPDKRVLYFGGYHAEFYLYHPDTRSLTHLNGVIDSKVTAIRPYTEDQLLIATDGAGLYQLDTSERIFRPYSVGSSPEEEPLNRNHIRDIYIDEDKRIWLANYPVGISIRNNNYPSYKWYHAVSGVTGNLPGNQVNGILQDSEGDYWFATDNSIGLLEYTTHTWHSFLTATREGNNSFYHTIEEVRPGIFWIGGHSGRVHEIDKRTGRVSSFTPIEQAQDLSASPHCIHAIFRDSRGKVWIGGENGLACTEKEGEYKFYGTIKNIRKIAEQDSTYLWIGTQNGLYRYDPLRNTAEKMELPSPIGHIHDLAGDKNRLYIGIGDGGLLIYHTETGGFEFYRKENSNLTSDQIYTLIDTGHDCLLLSTGNGISCFNKEKKSFSNWAAEQGLPSGHFNPASGTLTNQSTVLIGSSEGAIEFSDHIEIPQPGPIRLYLENLSLYNYQAEPGASRSPLKVSLDDTRNITLKVSQNNFTILLSSISYDCPSDILYSWNLDGYYNSWTTPGTERSIQYTNLDLGKYKLTIRAISSEDFRTLDERTLSIHILTPIWKRWWMIFLYVVAGLFAGITLLRAYLLRKERKSLEEKFQLVTRSIEDIRTPITLVKAPLDDIFRTEQLTADGKEKLDLAIRNIDILVRLTDNLSSYKKHGVLYTAPYIRQYELNGFLEKMIHLYEHTAVSKKVSILFEPDQSFINVWTDIEKLEILVKNVLANAFKYTPEGGKIEVLSYGDSDHWNIEIRDTGSGLPGKEHKTAFRKTFGLKNSSTYTDNSDLSILIMKKLVPMLKGKYTISSRQQEGTVVKMTFQHGYKQFKKSDVDIRDQKNTPKQEKEIPAWYWEDDLPDMDLKTILIVEENDEIRVYLKKILENDYNVQLATNAHTALDIIKLKKPNLIITEYNLTGMREDELCEKLKTDHKTLDIPVIMTTTDSDPFKVEDNIRAGVDELYIKPYDMNMLKLSVSRILINRQIIRNKYLNADMEKINAFNFNCKSEKDINFIVRIMRS